MGVNEEDKHICTLPVVSIITQLPYTQKLPPSAGIWRHFCHALQYLILVSSRHKGTQNYLKSKTAILKERKHQLAQKNFFMIHPFSLLTLGWSYFICLICFSTVVTVPYSAYTPGEVGWEHRLAILFTDCIALMDMVLRFCSGYHHVNTKDTEFRFSVTAMMYLKGSFIFDFLGMLPYQEFNFIRKELPESFYYSKAFRIICFNKYFKILCNQWDVDFIIESRITLFIHSMLLMIWSASFFFSIAEYNFQIFTGPEIQWFYDIDIFVGNYTTWYKFISSLYFVSGFLTTAGLGYEKTTENIYKMIEIIICMMIGYLFLLYLIITTLQQTLYKYAVELQFDSKYKELQNMMMKKHLPMELQKKIYEYVNHEWDGKYFSEKNIHSTLSSHLQLEIKLLSCEKLLNKVNIFKTLSGIVIDSIVKELVFEIIMPGKVVIKEGTEDGQFVILKLGCVVETKNGHVIRYLKDGSYFGEEFLTKKNHIHKTTVTALEISEIFQLNNETWNKLCQQFPNLLNIEI